MYTWYGEPIFKYRDNDTGQFITDAEVYEWSKVKLNTAEDYAVWLADGLERGDLSLGEWQTQMKETIKDNAIQQYTLATGTSIYTPEDQAMLAFVLEDQYSFLQGFAAEIAAGLLTAGVIAMRSRMYIRSTREAFERGKFVTRKRYFKEMKWTLGFAEHCVDCLDFADMGWQKISKNPFGGAFPGSGDTRCLTNCQCRIMYR